MVINNIILCRYLRCVLYLLCYFMKFISSKTRERFSRVHIITTNYQQPSQQHCSYLQHFRLVPYFKYEQKNNYYYYHYEHRQHFAVYLLLTVVQYIIPRLRLYYLNIVNCNNNQVRLCRGWYCKVLCLNSIIFLKNNIVLFHMMTIKVATRSKGSV